MRVALIGRTQILYETALQLQKTGHQIACVITAKAAPEYTRNEGDFEKLAQSLGASFLLAKNLNDPKVEDYCKGLDLGISINWISIIQQKHINLFRLGILNAHHGDLPKFRGNACSNWAILRGEKNIVNTIHFMEGGQLDCGRVIYQDHLELGEDTTISDVYSWSEKVIPKSFCHALQRLEKDEDYAIKYANPDTPESFRCYPRLPEDNFIDWMHSAADIHNLIRAVCYPFSGAYTYHWDNGKVQKLIILQSRIVQQETKDLAVPGHVLKNDPVSGESHIQCGRGIIALIKCRYDNEPDDFFPGKRWKSIRMRLGVRVEDWLWTLSKSLRT